MEMSRSSTWRRLVEHPQQWVLACCVLLLVALLGRQAWFIGHALVYRPANSATTSSAPSENSRDLAERIAAAELFGRATISSTSQTLPETNLQLTLRGVFTAQDPHNASAMIETGEGHVQIVKTGANVAPDTVLQQVFSNHVVLTRNGALESLYFPIPQEAVGNVALAQQNTMPANTETVVSSAAADSAATASPEELKRAVILRRLEELRLRNSH